MMRRAVRWEVWLMPALGESYEALPANMSGFVAQRERPGGVRATCSISV